MGDMWRSQKMTLVQMIVQNDAAHAGVGACVLCLRECCEHIQAISSNV